MRPASAPTNAAVSWTTNATFATRIMACMSFGAQMKSTELRVGIACRCILINSKSRAGAACAHLQPAETHANEPTCAKASEAALVAPFKDLGRPVVQAMGADAIRMHISWMPTAMVRNPFIEAGQAGILLCFRIPQESTLDRACPAAAPRLLHEFARQSNDACPAAALYKALSFTCQKERATIKVLTRFLRRLMEVNRLLTTGKRAVTSASLEPILLNSRRWPVRLPATDCA